MQLGQGTGPLQGVKVVEIAGIGPGPHGCQILADLGADVIRVERPGGGGLGGGPHDLTTRGRPSVALDLKRPEAVETVLRLVESADVLVEGMRPGVTERLGLGPDDCLARNPRLVYARMTGWGQTGPLAEAAGHDLTYIATAGALFGLGQDPARPHFPMNLLGDFGGGSTYLVIGILAALLEARVSGKGQVVDAAIVDGAAHLQTMFYGQVAAGAHQPGRRVSGMLDGGIPFYDVYGTSDGRHVAVGPLESKFYAEFCTRLAPYLGEREMPGQYDLARFAEMRETLSATFATRTMAEWAETFEGTDACVAPILTLTEAAEHPHLSARGTLVEHEGVLQPAPAPRFSRTAPTLGAPPAAVPGAHTRAALAAWGIDDVDALVDAGVALEGK
ncbi:CaiB/BaiF CoA-transferase family protein [Nocardioides sp. CER19]|uniref:CaiB/BaiF CoA transferase family protein n=1 Tax=Nocardioides sp. CER19 TaxID=3038538 RepID=UPI002448D73E|nr:CaiB/BaiF CoA-transferase family protein [Nocardioides sp. CER19]MDH2412699.1 CaiB/BaiF CoA-transferase family protein [Nocardioides sp. CER19]